MTKQTNTTKQELLKIGKQGEFWKIIVDTLEESKDYIQEQQDSEELKELTAEQYKFQNEIFKAKKKFLEILINTPDNIITWLEKPTSERKEFDPYE